ncbi:MAG: carbohydrate ABC transporter permease [Treponema sp.]|jgi:putative aldouronate transport system permease protein|nr:carbohydrate ABC transporter permease [Treponema sp.]
MKKIKKLDIIDVLLFILLSLWGLVILIPFLNAVAISFTSHKEYLESPLLLIPKAPEFKAYQELFNDSRIGIGYRTTLTIIAIGVPLSLFLSSATGYALSRRGYPGRKFFLYFVIFTMIFHGGIVPTYLVVRSLKLTNTIWSVILTGGMNTFYMILMYNYFRSLPESLMESARLDGASEWRILFNIVIPLSLPIVATLTLFYTVDKWNEWFGAMIYIRKSTLQPLQLVLRSIVFDSITVTQNASAMVMIERPFTMGIKMAAVVITMLPIMCIYPFLQKHFAKGVMVGAIKA